jgi:hypothetical protein
MVFSSTVVSIFSGDYKGVTKTTIYYLSAGLFTIFVAVIVVAMGSI